MSQAMNREIALEALSAGEPFDLLIIGGGATGLGTAVDAASRGYRVALVEQADFAKGTSSRSTKLVHGGVRYLKQGNVGLVREALHERALLHANAPHLVRELAFVIPNYGWFDEALYGIGLKAYDLLAGSQNLSPSSLLGREDTIERLPTVRQEGLVGGVQYYDGQFDDARLAISLARTAWENGAILANYVAARGLVKEGGRTAGAELEDLETGAQFTVRARCVVNATGVFVDALRQMDEPAAEEIVAVSQGVHLVLPREFLPGDCALMVPKTADGRVLFAVPWHGRVVLGTTDTPVERAALEPRALEEEVEFLVTHCEKYLERAPKPEDVRSLFAGLRPLVRKGGGGPTSALSRDHTILVSDSGLLTITGGKWTTYRNMAEDVVDRAREIANLSEAPCVTENLRVHGYLGPDSEVDFDDELGVYGSDAASVRASGPAGRLHPDLPYLAAEVLWQARQEMARTVEDVLARRTRALLLDARAATQAAPKVAELLAAELGWDETRRVEEVDKFTRLAAGYVLSE
jgi:glycerol-3-phosphate dehydrogenase